MSVLYSFIKKDGKKSEIFHRACFGNLIYGGKYTADIQVMTDSTHLVYAPYLPDKCARNFKKKYEELCDHFKWFSDITEVVEDYFNEKEFDSIYRKTQDPRSCYPLVIKLNLNFPSDTIWFCLNTIRLLDNSLTSSYYCKLFSEYHETLGVWRALVLLHFYWFSKPFGSNTVTPSVTQPNITSTCLFTPFHGTVGFFKDVVENPFKHLNKYPVYAENKNRLSLIPDFDNYKSVEEGYERDERKFFLKTMGFTKRFSNKDTVSHLKNTLSAFLTEEEILKFKNTLPNVIFN